jgi:predicted transcriptional regulator
LPVDPARLNAVGDLVLTEARELRALADTLRLTLFDLVRREGPVATSVLAKRVDRDRAQVDENLRELEALALVERTAWDEGDVVWASDVKGIYFEIPDSARSPIRCA